MKCVAIITARGGSKRIPRKNIKDFLGKPIIAYPIAAAIESGCFEEVMVSTDDQEIADVGLSLGAKVPFMRSQTNSDDLSTTADVIREVLNDYQDLQINYEYCCCIYPTAPFITKETLAFAYKRLIETGADSVVPVVRYSSPILRAFTMDNGNLQMHWPEYMTTRTQDLPDFFHDSGQFYFLKVAAFQLSNKIFSSRSVGLELLESQVQDIDTLEDWKIAELKYSLINKI
ncbi:pseudaminic acid cytidylyltransferase [Flavitalea antarctica]